MAGMGAKETVVWCDVSWWGVRRVVLLRVDVGRDGGGRVGGGRRGGGGRRHARHDVRRLRLRWVGRLVLFQGLAWPPLL